MRGRCDVLFCFLGLAACGADNGGGPPPAHVENPSAETALTTVHLTAQAAERIGIQLVTVQRNAIQSRRTFGGELVAPSGAAMALTAPRAATVLPPQSGRYPVAGDVVAAGQELVRLATLPPDLGRAREDAAAAEARATNARAKAERAQRLLDQGIASRAELEDARAELDGAVAAADAARARLNLMESGALPADDADLSPIALNAPAAVVVMAVHAAVGQTVSDGALVMEVVKADPLWARVPVYSGDRARVLKDGEASVRPEGAADAQGIPGIAISGPPTADAASSSVDLYYRVANPGLLLRPGERVSVSVPLTSAAEGLTVPWQAIVIDINGGTWLYHLTGDQAYTRVRVEVAEVVDGMAVLRRGPPEGSQVVAVGAAELFSTEFGTSH